MDSNYPKGIKNRNLLRVEDEIEIPIGKGLIEEINKVNPPTYYKYSEKQLKKVLNKLIKRESYGTSIR